MRSWLEAGRKKTSGNQRGRLESESLNISRSLSAQDIPTPSCVEQVNISGQIIATSHDLGPQKVTFAAISRKSRLVKYYDLARIYDKDHPSFWGHHRGMVSTHVGDFQYRKWYGFFSQANLKAFWMTIQKKNYLKYMFPHVSEGILWIVLMRFWICIHHFGEGLFMMGHNIGFFPQTDLNCIHIQIFQLPGMYFCKQNPKKQISSENAKTFISIGLSPLPGIVSPGFLHF